MGTVYLAEDVALYRKAAVKVLNGDVLDNDSIVERFFREARAVNDIGHDNIIEVLDFTDDRDGDSGQVYMVMEYLEGQDLRGRIRQAGAMETEEALAVARQVADALVAVHEKQIIHRDLKPENIFLLSTPEQDFAAPWDVEIKLLDFGLVRDLGPRRQAKLTEHGSTVGTPPYMAPEQVLSSSLDARTDIYALGMVLYEMLSGRLPFDEEGISVRELLMKTVTDAALPLSVAMPEGKFLPPGLEQTVMRCLAKEPASRYQTVEELRDVLDRLAMGPATMVDATQEVLAAPAPATRPASRWRAALFMAPVLFIITALVLAGVMVLERSAPVAPVALPAEPASDSPAPPRSAPPAKVAPVPRPVKSAAAPPAPAPKKSKVARVVRRAPIKKRQPARGRVVSKKHTKLTPRPKRSIGTATLNPYGD